MRVKGLPKSGKIATPVHGRDFALFFGGLIHILNEGGSDYGGRRHRRSNMPALRTTKPGNREKGKAGGRVNRVKAFPLSWLSSAAVIRGRKH
jgi:hypothetical protein